MNKNQFKKFFSFFNQNKRILLGIVLSLIMVFLLDFLFSNHSPKFSLKNLSLVFATLKKVPNRLGKYFSKKTHPFSQQKKLLFLLNPFHFPFFLVLLFLRVCRPLILFLLLSQNHRFFTFRLLL